MKVPAGWSSAGKRLGGGGKASRGRVGVATLRRLRRSGMWRFRSGRDGTVVADHCGDHLGWGQGALRGTLSRRACRRGVREVRETGLRDRRPSLYLWTLGGRAGEGRGARVPRRYRWVGGGRCCVEPLPISPIQRVGDVLRRQVRRRGSTRKGAVHLRALEGMESSGWSSAAPENGRQPRIRRYRGAVRKRTAGLFSMRVFRKTIFVDPRKP